MSMDINLAREIVTVVSFLAFVGILLWTASGRNRKRFEEAARIPLVDDETLSQGRGSERGRGFRE